MDTFKNQRFIFAFPLKIIAERVEIGTCGKKNGSQSCRYSPIPVS